VIFLLVQFIVTFVPEKTSSKIFCDKCPYYSYYL